MPKLFVYGTLRKGEPRHRFMHGSRFLGEAYVQGYNLYVVYDYPGMKEGEGVVWGELYEVSKELLHELDWVEGAPELFRREFITVKLRGGEELTAYAYIYNHSVDGLELIPLGDWTEHKKKLL
ncbi:gamma-glutamylcyclotransferase family protein [Thermocrinis sp.]